MPKNVQTTLQSHSCHMLARQCSKSFKIGFSSSTEIFQMYKLDLEKAEEPEIKLPTSIASQRIPKKICFCFFDYAKALDCVYHNKLWKILKEMGIADHLTCLLRNLFAGQKQEFKLDMGQWTHSQWGKEYIKALYYHPACLTNM